MTAGTSTERTLDRNYDRYSRCLRDYWWNQPVQYACGLEFAMVAELALFRRDLLLGRFPGGRITALGRRGGPAVTGLLRLFAMSSSRIPEVTWCSSGNG